jgi:RND family efflux transporter MFP subunit
MSGRIAQKLGWIGAFVVMVVGAGIAWWLVERGDAAPAQAAPPPPAVTVSEPLRREIIEWDEFTGQFASVEYVEVRARVSGFLQGVHFEDGQFVKKGDLLFTIDPRPFEAALASSKAQLAQSQSRLDLANRQLARGGELRQRDFLAQSTYDERLEETRAATAAVDSARAAIRLAELDLEWSKITAPIGGRVSRHLVSAGNLVNAGTTLLTNIVSLDPIYLVFDMSEADHLAYQRAIADGRLKSTRENTVAAFVKLGDEREWKREGHLNFLDNQVDRSAGTIRARAIFPNSDFFITPGQFGRLRLPGSERYEALLLPDSALVTDQAQKIVMTVSPDGIVVPKRVRPGPIEDGLRIIRSGLDPHDKVIINGLLRAKPGAKVTPQDGKIEVPAEFATAKKGG